MSGIISNVIKINKKIENQKENDKIQDSIDLNYKNNINKSVRLFANTIKTIDFTKADQQELSDIYEMLIKIIKGNFIDILKYTNKCNEFKKTYKK